jgi:hypothetical protein
VTKADVQAWLDARTPARPPELDRRMAAVLTHFADARLASAGTLAEAMAELGAEMLHCVAGSPDPKADGLALDLLAADAFATYAFEAAAEERVPVGPLVQRMLAESA